MMLISDVDRAMALQGKALAELLYGSGFWPMDPLMRRSIQRKHGRAVYVLQQRVTRYAGDGWRWAIKPGATTDWASVPRWATPLVPIDDKAGLAALLHDDLLEDRSHGLTRAQIDERFHEALRDLGVARWRAWAMWAAVRFQAWRDGDRP